MTFFLGIVHRRMGEKAAARQLLSESAALYRRIGAQELASKSEGQLADLEAEITDPAGPG
jgi:hypothetical protein